MIRLLMLMKIVCEPEWGKLPGNWRGRSLVLGLRSLTLVLDLLRALRAYVVKYLQPLFTTEARSRRRQTQTFGSLLSSANTDPRNHKRDSKTKDQTPKTNPPS